MINTGLKLIRIQDHIHGQFGLSTLSKLVIASSCNRIGSSVPSVSKHENFACCSALLPLPSKL
ncbi:hypothetical protein GIB67_021842 [Kingdonia uniflora]|uniref:Uncharacterized protein n=1 Tax=Kingdonia uniflora TaxID=39325 RepID=A0A7J7P7C0_9MAGN|nr:hypothetical protein GIB67_021842 [Kingdonia uniflora]